jgi:hypothetical protein
MRKINLKSGEKIIKKAEGRNQFWVAEKLAEAYLGNQKKTEAKKVLQAYLKRQEINGDEMKSTKKSMEEMLTRVQ